MSLTGVRSFADDGGQSGEGSDEGKPGALWGAYNPVGDKYGANRQAVDDSFADQVGRQNMLERVYYEWDDGWPQVWDYLARDEGRQLLISWSATTRGGGFIKWKDIGRGVYDGDIDRLAEALKDFGSSIYFAFNHEPDNHSEMGTAADYVSAYKHIHDRLQSDGVTNVYYVAILMAYTYRIGAADPYYPGDSYVDFIGADGFNWYKCEDRDDGWSDFSWIFQAFYDYGEAHRKPMMIAEFASGEDPRIPGRKATWLASAALTLKGWPDVKGVSYYNTGYADPDCNRWVDSSLTSLAAYVAMGADPYFNPATPPPPDGYDAYVGANDNDFTPLAGVTYQGVKVDFHMQGPDNNHTITDDSGMDWYDSKVLPVNADWQWTYNGAGNYAFECTLHTDMTLIIKIPIQVSPLTGHTWTSFKVTWAAAAPPSGFAYDIQIERPGDDWEGWKTGVTTTSASFVPDDGKGTYSFRARMKRNTSGAGSWYSVPVDITVTA
jgi:plastocyanin